MGGEMAYEEPPEVDVPLIRDWLTPAFRAWTRVMYGGRRLFVAWGCLFFIWAIFAAVKAVIYWSVTLLMCAAFLLTGLVDICTYRWRYKQAVVRAWAQYIG